MSTLGGSAVTTVLPIVNRDLGSNVATIQWVIIVYLLVVSALLLGFGRLGDLRGYKSIYVSGFAVFVLASALCGLARTTTVLIAARGVQGIGAAMLFATSPAILTTHFPATERGRALGLQAMMTYLGLTVGPSLGGWLTGWLGWRAVFFANVPVGLFALWLSWRVIPRDPAPRRGERFDWAGASIFMSGLVALLVALNRAYALGWTSPIIVTLLAVFGLALAAFLLIEGRVPTPMLDLTLFRRRLFGAAAASALLNYICVSGTLLLLPFYLIQGRGLHPAQAGLLLTAQPLVMSIAAPLSGMLSDRIGVRLPGTLGMAILAAGLFLLAGLGPHSPVRDVITALIAVGLGTGTFISPNTSGLMGAAPRDRQGIAGGILATARSVGMVLGVGLQGAVFTTVLARAQARSSPTALFDALSAAFLTAAGIAAIGVLTSMGRGKSDTLT
jgi:EmrB/QacA subfamily drug resistance transporter